MYLGNRLEFSTGHKTRGFETPTPHGISTPRNNYKCNYSKLFKVPTVQQYSGTANLLMATTNGNGDTG